MRSATAGGIGCQMGEDGGLLGTPKHTGNVIDNCNITGSSIASIRGGFHCWELGWTSGGILRNSSSDFCGIGTVDKGSDNSVITNILIGTFYSSAVLAKGATNDGTGGYTLITINQTSSGAASSPFFHAEDNPDDPDVPNKHSTGIKLDASIFTNAGGVAAYLNIVEVDNTVLFGTDTPNTYVKTSGSINAIPWQVGAVNVTLCNGIGGWKDLYEPGAICTGIP